MKSNIQIIVNHNEDTKVNTALLIAIFVSENHLRHPSFQ